MSVKCCARWQPKELDLHAPVSVRITEYDADEEGGWKEKITLPDNGGRALLSEILPRVAVQRARQTAEEKGRNLNV